jgi:hypothetical protein
VKRTVGGTCRAEGVLLCPNGSHLNLFRHRKCVIDLDAKVSRGALDLGMAEQQLNGTQVAGSAIDQRGLGRRNECVPNRLGSRPMLATHPATRRAYCRVVIPPPRPQRLPNRKSPGFLPAARM